MNIRRNVILLATYNGEKYLSEFFESLTNQSCKNFLLIVRDDESSDNTLNIISNYSNKLNITLLNSNIRLGAACNFIQLLIESGDEFDNYFFADQDDYWHPNKIERAQVNLAEYDNLPTMYCAGLELVDSDLSHISFTPLPRVIDLNNALVENIVTGCTIAINSKARHFVIDHLPRKFSMHDWWFYIVFSALGKIVYDDYVSLKYRQHSHNTIGSAKNIYQDLNKKLKRFFSKRKSGVFSIADQSKEFDRCYGRFLSIQQRKLVQDLIVEKASILGRVRLAFSSRFIRQKKVDTIILRILFLLGRF
jgi:glycosyltransferase involved in cell wall biosynthesis